MSITNLSSVGNTAYPLRTHLIVTTIWLSAKKRLVSIIMSGPGIVGTVLTVAFIFGATIVLIKKYYDKYDDRKISEFLQSSLSRCDWRGQRLNLSNRYNFLKHFNLVKLGEKIHEASQSKLYFLILQNCKLTDADLEQLGKAGWFESFSNVDLSGNPQITHNGLEWVGKGGVGKLEMLDLSGTDLIDDDLKQIALSGYFNGLSTLILSDNPRLTGKGLAWIAERGFKGLKKLNLAANPQVLKSGLNEWLEKGGFENLEVLNLNETSITEDELEQMIEKAEWFRKLKGLSLESNANLIKFPSNILKLAHLEDHSVTSSQLMSGGNIYFQGSGLFFRSCVNLAYTQEILELAMESKVFGGNLKENIVGSRELKKQGLQKLCEFYKIPFKQEQLAIAT